MGGASDDVSFELNQNEPIVIDAELYEKLNFRIVQDNAFGYHSIENFLSYIKREDVFVLEGAIPRNLNMIKKFGDATGLKRHSIHFSMQHYSDSCPNPYEDFVYNIEVADHHTYFVGHDAVWVHGAN